MEEILPIGWIRTELGEICSFEYGKSLPKRKRKEDGKVDVYGSNGVVGNHSEALIEGPCLIIGRKGAVGQVHLSAKSCWPIDTTYYVNDNENYSIKFLSYLLESIDLASLDKSTAIPGINRNDAYGKIICLPPLQEQYRIVEKIDELFSELDNGIESLKAAQEQLKVYRQAVLKAAFEGMLTEEWRKQKKELPDYKGIIDQIKKECELGGRRQKLKDNGVLNIEEINELPRIPSNWVWVKLFSFTDIMGGITKGRDFKGKETIKLPYLRVANVQDGYLDLGKIKEIELLEGEKDKYLLRANDILYTEGGDKDKLGRGTVWNNEVSDCVFQNHIFRARRYGESINYKYIAYYSQSKTAKNYFFSKAKQTVNLASINKTVLSNLPVPIPSITEQDQIVQEIESRLSVCDEIESTIEQSLSQAEALRQSILKKAFEGRLVPQDPEDEPAKKLLERIRAEREKAKINGTKGRATR